MTFGDNLADDSAVPINVDVRRLLSLVHRWSGCESSMLEMEQALSTPSVQRMVDWFRGNNAVSTGTYVFMAFGERQSYKGPQTRSRAALNRNQNEIFSSRPPYPTTMPLFLQSLCSSPHIRRQFGIELDLDAKSMYPLRSPVLCSLDDVFPRDKAPPLAWRLQVASQAINAISDMHTLQIVHGDLSMQYFCFSCFETGCEVQLSSFSDSSVCLDPALMNGNGARHLALIEAEFGLTRQRPLSERTRTDIYAAPEHRGKASSGTYAGDVYSLGVVVARVLSWQAAGAAAVRPACSEDIARLVERCLSLDPLKRPASACEVRKLWLNVCPPASTVPPPAQLWAVNESEAKRLKRQCPPRQPGAPASFILQNVMPVTLGTADCPVCMKEGQQCVPSGCGYRHAVYLPCAVEWVRTEVGDLQHRGVRCPSCMSDAPDCQVTLPVLCTITAWSRATRGGLAQRPISSETLLLACQLSSPLPVPAEGNSTEPAAPSLPCMKRCPRCSTPISHPRGHGCHHIRCKCRHEFCYNCLGPHEGSCGCGTHCSSTCLCEDCPECSLSQARRGTGCPTCAGSESCHACRRAELTRENATFESARQMLQAGSTAQSVVQALAFVRHASSNYTRGAETPAVQWQVIQLIHERCECFLHDSRIAMEVVGVAQTDWYQQQMNHALTPLLVAALGAQAPTDTATLTALLRQLRDDGRTTAAEAAICFTAVCTCMLKNGISSAVRRECTTALESLASALTSYELHIPKASLSPVVLALLQEATAGTSTSSQRCLKLLTRVLTNPEACAVLVYSSEHLRSLEALGAGPATLLYTLAILNNAHLSLQSAEDETAAERILDGALQSLLPLGTLDTVDADLLRSIQDRLAYGIRRLRDDMIKYTDLPVSLQAVRLLKQTLVITAPLVHDNVGFIHECWKLLEASCVYLSIPLPPPPPAPDGSAGGQSGCHPLVEEALSVVSSIMLWTALCLSWGHGKATRKYVSSFLEWCMPAVTADIERLLSFGCTPSPAHTGDKSSEEVQKNLHMGALLGETLTLVQWASEDTELASTLPIPTVLSFLLGILSQHSEMPGACMSATHILTALCLIPSRQEEVAKHNCTWEAFGHIADGMSDAAGGYAAAEGLWALVTSPFGCELASQTTAVVMSAMTLVVHGIEHIAKTGQLLRGTQQFCMCISILSSRQVGAGLHVEYGQVLSVVLSGIFSALTDAYPTNKDDLPLFAKCLTLLRNQQEELWLGTGALLQAVIAQQDDGRDDGTSTVSSKAKAINDGDQFFDGLMRMGLQSVLQPMQEHSTNTFQREPVTKTLSDLLLRPFSRACAWLVKDGAWLLHAQRNPADAGDLSTLAGHVMSTITWMASLPCFRPLDVFEEGKQQWQVVAHPGLEEVFVTMLWCHHGPATNPVASAGGSSSGEPTATSLTGSRLPPVALHDAVMEAYSALVKQQARNNQNSHVKELAQRARVLSVQYGLSLLHASTPSNPHSMSLHKACGAGLHELLRQWKEKDLTGLVAELNVIPEGMSHTPFALTVSIGIDTSVDGELRRDAGSCVRLLAAVPQLNPVAVGDKEGKSQLWWAARAGLTTLVTSWASKPRVTAQHLLPFPKHDSPFTIMCRFYLNDQRADLRKCALALGMSDKMDALTVDSAGQSDLLYSSCAAGLHEVVQHMCKRDKHALANMINKRQGHQMRTVFAEVAYKIHSLDFGAPLRADLCLCAEALASLAGCDPTAVGCKQGKTHLWLAFQACLPTVLEKWLKHAAVTPSFIQANVPTSTSSAGSCPYSVLVGDWAGHVSGPDPGKKEKARAIAQCLIALGESKKVKVQLSGDVGSLCPMFLASKAGCDDLVSHWLSAPDLAGTCNWQASQASESSHTPLTVACSVAGAASTPPALKAGARACAERLSVLYDPTATGGCAYSSLFWACYAGLEHCVATWMEHEIVTMQWLTALQGADKLPLLHAVCAALRGEILTDTPMASAVQTERCIMAVLACSKQPVDAAALYWLCWAGSVSAVHYVVLHRPLHVVHALNASLEPNSVHHAPAGHTVFTAVCAEAGAAGLSADRRTALQDCARCLTALPECSPTAIGGQRLSYLYWACAAGLVDVVRAWLTRKEVTDAWLAAQQGDNGRTLFAELCFAVSLGTGDGGFATHFRECAVRVGKLTSNARCSPATVDRAGTSHLYWACIAGLHEVVLHWVNSDVDAALRVLHRCGHGTRHTPLTVACRVATGGTSSPGKGQQKPAGGEQEGCTRQGARECAKLLLSYPPWT